VAKGNDGNYFQHSIEVTVATHLAGRFGSGQLHFAFGHAMAPFEECEQAKPGQSRGLLLSALNESYSSRKQNEPEVVAAYRATNTTLSRYPNSAELLRAALGAERLRGGLTEVDGEKYQQLVEVWAAFHVRVANTSWRSELKAPGVLACPSNLDRPWLFTLDPMTYKDGDGPDDNNVHQSDLERLSGAIGTFVRSGLPGVAAVFVYAVRPESRSGFWRFADAVASRSGAALSTYWHIHQGGNRNLAALFRSGCEFPAHFPPKGISDGTD
jgi:hypothetical protein